MQSNYYKMVSVTDKKPTHRVAIATGKIIVGKQVFNLIKTDKLPKGNSLLLSEIAGINAAKEAYRMIPLCHPLGLDHVSIYHELDEDNFAIIIYSEVSAFAKTGVEMEALAAVNAALLSIYDLSKMVEATLTISDIRLVIKKGGKKGFWTHPDGIPDFVSDLLTKYDQQTIDSLNGVNTAIITISDRAANNIYQDKSGELLKAKLSGCGAVIDNYLIIPDSKVKIKEAVLNYANIDDLDFIITTGGTGIAPRDLTYNVMQDIGDKEIIGFGELLRQNGAKYTKYSWLSLTSAWLVKQKLVIILPGSVNAVKESLEVIIDLVPHTLKMIKGKGHD